MEHHTSYHPAKFHWPRVAGLKFMRGMGNTSPQTYTLSKKPNPHGVNIKKSDNISGGKALYFRNYEPKIFTGGGGGAAPPQCL